MTARLVNPVKDRLRAGGTVLGTLISMPSPNVAQVLAGAGFDWLWFDLEHGPIPFDALQGMVNATATGAGTCTPIVRVPNGQHWMVKPVLDCGALGVVFPFVETPGEAAENIAATRYPPAGNRGFGPFYAGSRWGLGLREYAEQADDAILRIMMLESAEAVKNAEEIMAVEGIDVAFLAPFDLSQSLGVPGEFDSSVFQDALATLEAAVGKTDAALGTLVLDAERGRAMIERGYRFVMLSLDIALLEGAAKTFIGDIGAP